MRGIVNDPEVGAHFAVLVIVKLNQYGHLEGSVSVFYPAGHEYSGELVFEEENATS